MRSLRKEDMALRENVNLSSLLLGDGIFVSVPMLFILTVAISYTGGHSGTHRVYELL